MAANADRPEPVRRAATGPMAGPGRHIFAAHLFAERLRWDQPAAADERGGAAESEADGVRRIRPTDAHHGVDFAEVLVGAVVVRTTGPRSPETVAPRYRVGTVT